jgi:hypothetical protein
VPRCGATRCDAVCGATRCDAVRGGAVRRGVARCGERCGPTLFRSTRLSKEKAPGAKKNVFLLPLVGIPSRECRGGTQGAGAKQPAPIHGAGGSQLSMGIPWTHRRCRRVPERETRGEAMPCPGAARRGATRCAARRGAMRFGAVQCGAVQGWRFTAEHGDTMDAPQM